MVRTLIEAFVVLNLLFLTKKDSPYGARIHKRAFLPP